MNLRPYQRDAVSGVDSALKGKRSALVVMPTGTGKTVCFAHIARNAVKRVMVIAHREELVQQAVSKIRTVTGLSPDVEMAEYKAGRLYKSPVVVASVQTLCAPFHNVYRMDKFDPHEFDMLVIDEAHHATAASYRRVVDHFSKNPNLRTVGFTATPDRADKSALGLVFESVAFNYEIMQAMHDGWLVPIETQQVIVSGMDFSHVKTVAGDLNQGELSTIMEQEKVLHGVVSPAIEIAAGRKTLVFAASVSHAERMSEIFNRHGVRSAIVHGGTFKDDRRKILQAYADGKIQVLCNCGVAVEGFDCPTIEVVVIARPTKSRSLYTQMVGRGTRVLPNTVDSISDPAGRRAAIAASAKSKMLVIDFTGNSGKHKLVTTADILGGKYDEETIEHAKQKIAESGKPSDVIEELERAAAEVLANRTEELLQKKRRVVTAKVDYSTKQVDAFGVFNIGPDRLAHAARNTAPLTQAQQAMLTRNGIDIGGLPVGHCRALYNEILRRMKAGRCTYKQASLLRKYGYGTTVSFKEASKIIDGLKSNGWKKVGA
jgi:superfamily II DNA or RNA helicase